MFSEIKCPVVVGYLTASNEKVEIDYNKYKNLKRFDFEESLDRYLFCLEMVFDQCYKVKDIISFDLKENKKTKINMNQHHNNIVESVLRDMASNLYFGSRRVEKNRKMVKICEDAGTLIAEIKGSFELDKMFIKFKDINEDILDKNVMKNIAFKASKFLNNFKLLDFTYTDLL